MNIEELTARFVDLRSGLSNTRFAMHTRDIDKAYECQRKYLGRDVQSERKSEEFAQIAEEEQKRLKNERKLGEYGYFHHTQKPESAIALAVLLTLTARQILATGEQTELQNDLVKASKLEPSFNEQLEDPAFFTSILDTFPDSGLTKENLSGVMNPQLV